MQFKPLLLGLALGTASLTAHAALVYNNGIASHAEGYPIGGPVAGEFPYSSSDDFSVASATTIRTVGFYFNNFNGTTGWDGKVSYAIHANGSTPSLSNIPGAVLATGQGQNVTQLPGNFAWLFGTNTSKLISFDLVSGFTAQAGQTYWLELGGAGGAPNSFWVTSVSNTGFPGWANGRYTPNDFAFYLEGDLAKPSVPVSSVPLPTSLALFGLGVVGLSVIRRRNAEVIKD